MATQRNATVIILFYAVLLFVLAVFAVCFPFSKISAKTTALWRPLQNPTLSGRLIAEVRSSLWKFSHHGNPSQQTLPPFNRLIKEVHETQKRFCACASLIDRCVIG